MTSQQMAQRLNGLGDKVYASRQELKQIAAKVKDLRQQLNSMNSTYQTIAASLAAFGNEILMTNHGLRIIEEELDNLQVHEEMKELPQPKTWMEKQTAAMERYTVNCTGE